MESRLVGGLKIPVLSFGTATFGGRGDFFSAWGKTDVDEAARIVDMCLEAGVNMFDTADVYSTGASEEILGQGDRQAPQRGHHFDQSDLQHGRWSQRPRLVAPSPHQRP